ncbi:hypothetical protein [Fodinicola acaciae]|uniref:hypothetical protein n=1 Tax=Fodinicola acaciae TaxID=2681555 RepID=UPI0013D4F31A|nr:hypothetical protein [Fodinicola acaciae]
MNLHPEMLTEMVAQRQRDLRADAGGFHVRGAGWLRQSRRHNLLRGRRGADTLAACGPNVVPVR